MDNKFKLLFPILFIFSCGNQYTLKHQINKKKSFENHTHQSLYKILRSRTSRECINNHPNCKKNIKTFRSSKPEKKKVNQRILILDSERFPAYKGAFFSYKNRILNFLSYEANHSYYYPIWPKILYPKVLDFVFQDNIGKHLQELKEDEKNLLSKILLKLHHKIEIISPKKKDIAHGEYIFYLLASLNPQAQFLVAPFPEPSVDEFCHLPKSIENLKTKYNLAAKSLTNYINQHKISWINLSYSSSLSSIKRHFESLCQKPIEDKILKNFLAIKASFLDEIIKENTQLYLVQSLPNELTKEINTDASKNPFFQKRNRSVRVAYVSKFKSNIPPWGMKINENIVSNEQKGAMNIADIFINGGIDEIKASSQFNHTSLNFNSIDSTKKWWHKKSLHLDYYGVFQAPIMAMSNSWAAPLALSFLIYIESLYKKNQINKNLTRSFIFDNILEQKIFDPLKHQHFIKHTEG